MLKSFAPRLLRSVSRPWMPSVVGSVRMSHGLVDKDLAHKLGEEIRYENEAVDPNGEPDFLKNFKAQSAFQIEDIAGKDEVVLTRTFGNEKIRVVFSVDDINNMQDDDMFEAGSEENAENEAVEPEEAETTLENYPVHASVTITKPSSAIAFDIVLEEGEIGYESIVVYDAPEMATAESADADYERRSVYGGPQYGHLDEDVQVMVERFLEERGVDTGLATFIPNYIEWKEQREYVHWLNRFKKFVEE